MGIANEKVWAVVKRIPYGRVATYGQIARLAGITNPRHVGKALQALPGESDVPWHRVVNARGEVSERRPPGWDDLQRILLEAEGIEFRGRGRIPFDRYRWTPEGEEER
jgi:methylated-DNA-protein-cysteine methyltransferase-like protein